MVAESKRRYGVKVSQTSDKKRFYVAKTNAKQYGFELSANDVMNTEYIYLSQDNDTVNEQINSIHQKVFMAKQRILDRYNSAVEKIRQDMVSNNVDEETIESILSGEAFTKGAQQGEQSLGQTVSQADLSSLKVGNEDLKTMIQKARDFSTTNNMAKLTRQIDKAEALLQECMADGSLGKQVLQDYIPSVLGDYFSEAGRKTMGTSSHNEIAETIIDNTMRKIRDTDIIQLKNTKKSGTRLNTVLHRMLKLIFALSDTSAQGKVGSDKISRENFEKAMCDVMIGWNNILKGEHGEGPRFVAGLEATGQFLKAEGDIKYIFKNEGSHGDDTFKVEIDYDPDLELSYAKTIIPETIENLKKNMTSKTDNVAGFYRGDTYITKFDFTIKNYSSVKISSNNDGTFLNTTNSRGISVVSSTPLMNVLVLDLYLKSQDIHNLIQFGATVGNQDRWNDMIKHAKLAFILNGLIGRINEKGYVNTFMKINGAVIPIKKIWDYVSDENNMGNAMNVKPEYFIDREKLQNYNVRIGKVDSLFYARIRSASVNRKAYEHFSDQKVNGHIIFNNFKVL